MLLEILKELEPTQTQLVAVSKTRTIAEIKAKYDLGHRVFGENRVQELVEKAQQLPADIKWHQIGHLQTNKVKYIASFVELIHAVDSFKLLKEINKQAVKNNRIIDCLLQFHIAQESSKFGFDRNDCQDMLSDVAFNKLENVRILGVMGMATFTDLEAQVRKEFWTLKSIFEWLRNDYFQDKTYFKEISMGMSGDYKIAIEEGSTMVRIGSLLFTK